MVVYALDTYALVEIENGNPKYKDLISKDINIPAPILAEFYYVLLRERNKTTADYWFRRLKNYSYQITAEQWKDASVFRFMNKKRKLSFFDCIGYISARENGFIFVTGDKEFEKMDKVLYLK